MLTQYRRAHSEEEEEEEERAEEEEEQRSRKRMRSRRRRRRRRCQEIQHRWSACSQNPPALRSLPKGGRRN